MTTWEYLYIEYKSTSTYPWMNQNERWVGWLIVHLPLLVFPVLRRSTTSKHSWYSLKGRRNMRNSCNKWESQYQSTPGTRGSYNIQLLLVLRYSRGVKTSKHSWYQMGSHNIKALLVREGVITFNYSWYSGTRGELKHQSTPGTRWGVAISKHSCYEREL